jgi:hypothetical protein
MIILGPVLGMPVFATLLALVRLATRAHPLLREPLLPLGVDSTCAGFIIAAELVRVCAPAIWPVRSPPPSWCSICCSSWYAVPNCRARTPPASPCA